MNSKEITLSFTTGTVFKLAVFSTAFLTAMAAYAQEASTPPHDDEGDDAIELKATYVRPDYVEIERLRETKEIIVIPKEDIQDRGRRTISDVLKTVPSISIGNSGTGHIDIRGQGADQDTRNLQVLLDGAPITTLVSHPLQTDYDVIPVEQLERIEVIPGGGSVMYGSGAQGGIINISSNLRAMREPKTSASAEWNTKGYRLSGNVGGTFDDNRFAYDLSAARLNRDLYFVDTYRNSNYFSAGLRWNLTPSQQVVVRASRLEEKSQYINNVSIKKIKQYGEDYRPGTRQETIGLDAEGHKITRTVADYLNGDRKIDTVNASYVNDISESLHFSSDLFYNTGYFTGVDDENKQMDNDGYGLRAKLDWSYWNDSSLLIGTDLLRQKAELSYTNYKVVSYRNKTYKAIPLHYNYDKKTYALYALNTLKWNDFVFTQGARRELTKWGFDKNDTTEGAGSDVSNRWNTAFELSAAYNYRDTGKIYARYERGYTVPDGMQITDSIPNPNGSGKLMSATQAEDEKFDIYEIGLRDKVGFTTVSATAWMSDTDNQMNRFLYIDDAGLTRKTMNLLKSRRYGVDLALTQDFGKLHLKEAYSYLKGRTKCNSTEACKFLEDHNVAIDYASSGLQYVPKHKVSVSAEYEFLDSLSAAVQYTFFGKYNNFMKDNKAEEGGVMKSYSLVDLSMKWKPTKHIDVYAGVTNLFDKEYWDYQSSSGSNASSSSVVPGTGRAYFIGLKGTL